MSKRSDKFNLIWPVFSITKDGVTVAIVGSIKRLDVTGRNVVLKDIDMSIVIETYPGFLRISFI